ncbi:MAG: GTPase Era [Candidatus Magasanikbacteria bacterium GW2011_GWA2_45_39]|uniref:GTPase Era n=1 Tax=Candidatus Magasanikbacteria bacterium GW2011_GWA2_45_39 TaxID=1619041 RepID=A0A0G1MJ96_9BACT|nr:MAG: GTPase Era [Candidatus Magasanikbacteria bacterium GW2011_GWA2_45_39]HBW73981.1 GTPase Era [Candidatus Magasanikbacteria bacterium]
MEEIINKKSGFAVIIGRSNAGKSTLLNALVGTKLAIATPKPQTTRHVIHGVFNDDRGQIVFVDTPGFLTEKRSPLTPKLTEKIKQSLHGVEVIIYVVDTSRAIGQEEKRLLSLVRDLKLPKLFVINKIDLSHRELPYLEEYRALSASEGFTATIEVSALKHKHLKTLLSTLFEFLPEGESIYPLNQITNIDQRFFISELIREKVFHTMGDEVPYSVTVRVEEMEERKDGTLYIRAVILTFAERYKKMIIGAHARKIKEIGATVRKELELINNRHVYVDLTVKVDTEWEKSFE